MRIEEFIINHDLHDSLLESVNFLEGKLVLEIELCNWRQKHYNQNEAEMKSIKLVFNNVKRYLLDATQNKFDSDTILEIKCLDCDDENDISLVKIIVEGESDLKIIEFESSNVEICF